MQHLGLRNYHDAMQEHVEFVDPQGVCHAAHTVNSEEHTVVADIANTDLYGPEACLQLIL